MQLRITVILLFIILSSLGYGQDTNGVKSKPAVTDIENLIRLAEGAPEDHMTNYNLATHYYNQGISLIDNMQSGKAKSPDELIAIQQEVEATFNKALPYALKAYEISPNHVGTLTMLSGIYFGLNDIPKSEVFADLAAKAADNTFK
ncbi:MAG: hypothetical protein Salg2KO_12470 [Salibacteraceae bacterium]